MSEQSTEMKLPKAYKRPSVEEYVSRGYQAENYESFFESYEQRLAERYASGEITDETFVSYADGEVPASCPKCKSSNTTFPEPWTPESAAHCNDCGWDGKVSELLNFTADEMADADGDGLPDVLHVRSQVRSLATRMLRARAPQKHRFKQYLFGNPSLRLVRKRAVRVTAAQVRAGLDELIAKEAAGLLSVHAPNGQRVDLRALKAGRVELAALPAPAPLVNKPLDSAANDPPAGEPMPKYLGGTFHGDPVAGDVAARMAAEKQSEAEKKKEPVKVDAPGAAGGGGTDPADPAESTELQQPPTGVEGEPAPVQDQLPENTEAFVEAAPVVDPLGTDEPGAAAQPNDEPAKEASSSSKKGKKGGGK